MDVESGSELMQSIARAWYPQVAVQLLWIEAAYLLLMGPIRSRFHLGPPARPVQVLWFSLALFAAFLAEGTPVHLLSEGYLFSVHMVQHILLTLIMPPLVILGLPSWVYRPLLWPPAAPVLRVILSPLPALILFNAVYTLWHLPALYEAALFNHDIHIVEHVTMVATSFIMWWPVLSPVKEFPRLSEPLQLVYVFLMSVAQIAIFAVVTFSNKVLYEYYAQAPRLFGLTPQMDQQLAGIVMKVGGMLVFVFVLTVTFYKWAAREEARPGFPVPADPSRS